jgi:hypothetical protein
MQASLTRKEQALFNRAQEIKRGQLKLEFDFITVLDQIDQRRCYRKLGFSSLFVYAVNALDLTEAVAYSYITVARKARGIPDLKEALRTQTISVAKASRIVSTLTCENAKHLIEFSRSYSARETEREVERLNPERRNAKGQQSAKIKELIRRAQSLLSTKSGRHVDANKTLELVLEDFIERHDPVKKAERAMSRKVRRAKKTRIQTVESTNAPTNQNHLTGYAVATTAEPELCTYRVSATEMRKPFSAAEKHTVFATDKYCTFVDASGKRCRNDRWLHIHHLRPVRNGGTNDPDNLTLLCAEHHDLVHQLRFPLDARVSTQDQLG